MKETTSKEKVLKKIRDALITREDPFNPNLDWDSSVYQPVDDCLEIHFAEELTKVDGKFIFCTDFLDFIDNLLQVIETDKLKSFICLEKSLQILLDEAQVNYISNPIHIEQAETSITLCEALIARLGSVIVSSKQTAGRRLFSYAKNHIVVAYTSQLVPDIRDGLTRIREKYGKNIPSLITSITGPSRTADIEKTLVLGAHGPKELYVFLIDDTE